MSFFFNRKLARSTVPYRALRTERQSFDNGAICGVRAPNKDAGFLKSIKVFTPGESSIYGLFTCGGLPKVRNSPQSKGPHKDGQRRASQIRKSWDFLCLGI